MDEMTSKEEMASKEDGVDGADGAASAAAIGRSADGATRVSVGAEALGVGVGVARRRGRWLVGSRCDKCRR